MIRRLVSQPLLVGLFALAGCAEATDPDVSHAGNPLPSDSITGDAEQTVTAEIGPAGGAIDTDFGVSVTVPEGALLEQTTISVIFDPNGQALRFEPMGVQFEVAVQVSLPAVEGVDDEIALRCYAANLQACLEAPSALGGTMHPWLVNAAAEFGEIAAPDSAYPNVGTFGVPAILTL